MKNLFLSILLFLSITSLGAYNNNWADNEDYITQSDEGTKAGEGHENKEIKGKKKGKKYSCPSSTASPVYMKSGHFTWSDVDIVLAGKSGIYFSRSYTSKEPLSGMFGNGWISNLESGFIQTKKYVNNDGYTEIHYIYRKENGLRYTFKDINGTIQNPTGMYQKIEQLSQTSFKVTDENGIVDIYNNDLIISKEDINGNKREYIYNENDILTSIKDSAGNTLSFTYGANGFVTAISDQNMRVWRYAYDVDGNLISVTNPLDGVRTYAYEKYQSDNDAKYYFHLTKIIDEVGVVVIEVEYNKDIVGRYSFQNTRVKSYTKGEDKYTYNWNYLNSYKYVTKTDSLGTWERFYVSDSGHVVKYFDSKYKTFNYNIDENNTLTGVTDKSGNAWNQSVDDLGRTLTHTTPLGSKTTYTYKGDNRSPSTIVSPLGYSTAISYDSKNNPSSLTQADGSVYKATYDSKGNMLDITDPLGVKNSITTYNANSQALSITNALGDKTTLTYNSFDQVKTITDAEGNQVTFTYDLLGNLTKTVNPAGDAVDYSYDISGKLLSLKDPLQNATTYLYDTFGRISKVTRPNGRTLTYTYTTTNLISKIADSAGREILYTYDGLKRVTKVKSGVSFVDYTYDVENRVTRAYSKDMNGVGYYIYYTYNADGQLTQEKQNNQTVDYTYDADGKLATMSAKGITVTYTRDSMGRITSLSDATDTFSFTYDANGMRKSITYPNSLKANYTLDKASRLVAFDNGLSQQSYTYNKIGMISKKTVDSVASNYTYDETNRLVEVGLDTYSYDKAGNILNNSATYDSKTNQLSATSTDSYEYDNFGNLIKKIDKETGSYKLYSWGDWGELLKVESFNSESISSKKIEFTYGAIGRRLSKTVDGVVQRYLYSGQNLVAIMDSYSGLLYRVIHDEKIDSPLSIVDASGENRYYYHVDNLGSVMSLSDSNGNKVENYSYDAYGKTTKESTLETGNPFAYTARVMDDEDLYYYRARYYDSNVGRFLSEDPIGFRSGDFNLYRYVVNNPLNYADPYGYGVVSTLWNVTKTVVTGVAVVGAGIIAAPAVGVTATTGVVITTAGYAGYKLLGFFKDAGDAMKRNIKRRQQMDNSASCGDGENYKKLYNEGIDEARTAIKKGATLPGTSIGGDIPISGWDQFSADTPGLFF